MAAPTTARAAALETLRDVRDGTLLDRAFDRAAGGLDSRERAWTQELVYGTIRLRGRLDHVLATVSSRPLDRLDPDVLDILRLGAYQLIEMHAVPAYAAVSESVELAKRSARSAAGFVNAVLQSLRRQPASSTFPPVEHDEAAYLSSWGSHPRWLVERWIARYGAAATRQLVEVNNRRPELYLRALLPADEVTDGRGIVADRLRAAGIETEPVPFASHALRVLTGGAAAALDVAPVIVQDPAAGLVADYAAVPAGTVLDLAAAPGGKAIALAAGPVPHAAATAAGSAGRAGDGASAGGVFVVAADRSLERLGRLVENVHRLERRPPVGVGDVPVVAVVADNRAPPFRPVGVVLLDAPCTGTGTLRRHPDGRWRLTPGDLLALSTLQKQLLDAAAPLVEPGGLLVYSTCSLEPEENELQVTAFLERHTSFALERGGGVDDALIDDDGALRVSPQDHGVDGAYCARLRRHA